MLRHILNPPNWFTAASILCSVFAIATVTVPGPIPPRALALASILILFGTVFDLLDGRVARMTNRMTAFGVQLDSLADLISFGVAPALLAWVWVLHDLGHFGAFIAFAYVAAAAFRLARFNVNAAEPTNNWPLAGHSQGLTSTMAGFVLVSFVWVSNGFFTKLGVTIPAVAVALVVALLAFLMVSAVPYRNFRDFRRNRRARMIFAIGFAATLAAAVFADPSLWFGASACIYLFVGLADGLVTAVHHRRTSGRLSEEDFSGEELLGTDYDEYEEADA